jgi:uncharacterized protein (TIGR02246 family)
MSRERTTTLNAPWSRYAAASLEEAMPDTQTRRPIARRPEDLHALLATCFNAGDLEGLLDLYEPDATLVSSPGHAVTGTGALRDALAGFLALKPRETFVETVGVVLTDGCALTRSRWGLKGTDPLDGATVTLAHRGVEIMRRQPDGTWRFLIDDPFAGDLPD